MMITTLTGRCGFSLGLALACLVACSDHPVVDVDRVREADGPARVGANTQERFFQRGQDPHGGMQQPGGMPQPSAGSIGDMLEWDLPEGWEELPPAQFRDINLRVGSVECYVSVLGGGGGGAEGNINRWRGQMGLPGLSHEEFDALARAKLFGVDVPLVDIEGTNAGKPNQRMVAIFFEAPMAAITVKMLGPQNEVAAERAHFDEFCASLRLGGNVPAQTTGTGGSTGGGGVQAFDPSRLRWDAPTGWTQSGERQMRFATFDIADGTECYISLLSGAAGGVDANLNRWRQQVSLPPLSPQEIAALPLIPMLGGQQPFLEAYGVDGSSVLGSLVSLPEQTMFIKLTGPEATVRAEVDRFKEFCKSLRLEND